MVETVEHLDRLRFQALGGQGDWPEPRPLTDPLDQPEAFPMSALGPLSVVAEDIAASAKCPDAIAGAAVLGVASFAAQGRHDVEFMPAQVKPLTLNIISIGASGERKTTAVEQASLGVERFERKLYADAARLAREEPDAPAGLPPVIQLNDGTIEGIAKGLSEGYPSQMLSTDEAGRFFGGYSMSSEKRLSTLTWLSKFFDGRPDRRRIRGTGNQSIDVSTDGCRLAVHLMGQREAIDVLFQGGLARGLGTLARFLVHEPASRIGTRQMSEAEWHRTSRTEAVVEFADAVERRLASAVERDCDGNVERDVLRLTPEANNRLRAFFNRIESELGPQKELEGYADLLNKVHEHAARIAGVLADFKNENPIGRETIDQGIELAEYFRKELIRLADAAPHSQRRDDAIRIAKYIAYKGGSLMTEQLSKNISPKPLRKLHRREPAIDLLEEAGWITTRDKQVLLNPLVAERGLLEAI